MSTLGNINMQLSAPNPPWSLLAKHERWLCWYFWRDIRMVRHS